MTDDASLSPSMTSSDAKKNPHVSIFLATACGLGYLPKAPGTWGSLGGLVVTLLPFVCFAQRSIAAGAVGIEPVNVGGFQINAYLLTHFVLTLVIAALGVWTATNAAHFWGQDDPQKVVVDEVSGQHISIVLGCALPISRSITWTWQPSVWGFLAHDATLNWKYLLTGFILFRAFDIWKPFPARQLENLHGGWGIMADDWMAGIYAAIGLWIARAAGL
jgi:phosphatidylglycerophosphatase A